MKVLFKKKKQAMYNIDTININKSIYHFINKFYFT